MSQAAAVFPENLKVVLKADSVYNECFFEDIIQLHPNDFAKLMYSTENYSHLKESGIHVYVKGDRLVFVAKPLDDATLGKVYMGHTHRIFGAIMYNEELEVKRVPTALLPPALKSITFEVDVLNGIWYPPGETNVPMVDVIHEKLDSHVFKKNQFIPFSVPYNDTVIKIKLCVRKLKHASPAHSECPNGMIVPTTRILVEKKNKHVPINPL